jgi:hypothetical protein
MTGNTKRLIVVGLLVLVIGAAVLAVLYQRSRPGPQVRMKVDYNATPPEAGAPSVLSPPAGALQGEEGNATFDAQAPVEPPATMENAEEVLDQRIPELSTDPLFRKWASVRDAIGRFVASVDLLSRGESPNEIFTFLRPEEPFEPAAADGTAPVVIDEKTYRRYDTLARVVGSLNAPACVRAYRVFAPVLQTTYQRLGYPEGNFDASFKAALVELLGAPLIVEPVFVRKKVLTYAYLDADLESRSDAQKHLMRMGPRNMKLIQAKLREIALGLGIPEHELPDPSVAVQ